MRSEVLLRAQSCCSEEPEAYKQIQWSQPDGGRMVN